MRETRDVICVLVSLHHAPDHIFTAFLYSILPGLGTEMFISIEDALNCVLL